MNLPPRAATLARPRPGGRVLVDALVAHGVRRIFAVPGESYLPTLDALFDRRRDISLITCRTEQGAVHMAEACGRLSGHPAAAFVTRGPGACQAAIGVHVAFQDSTPLLLFVGQIPFAETDRESFQEIDYRRMFAPIAKFVTQIDQAARIPEIVAHAMDIAVSGRPGPVVIALSEEMQRAEVTVADIGPAPVAVAHPSPEGMAQMQAMLGASERPLAILGGGGWNAAGRTAIRAFLHGNDLPVAVAFRRQSLFEGTSVNYVGDLGVGSDPALVAAARSADLILAIGTRLGEAVTQGYTLFAGDNGLKIVHVHADGAEIGRVVRPALGIVSDVNAFAEAAAALEPLSTSWYGWTTELRDMRRAWREPIETDFPLNTAEVMRELAGLLADDAILTTDAGNFAGWPTRFIDFRDRQRYIGPANGAMGYGVPAAVGAAIAYPGRQVVCFVGDGGMLMTGQEVATARHHGVAPILIVFNNAMFGTIRMHQERDFPGRVCGTSLTNPDFALWMQSFGGHGETVTHTAEFGPAFRRAMASGRPSLIELRTDPDQLSTRFTTKALRGGQLLLPSDDPEPAPAGEAPPIRRPRKGR